VIDGGEMSRWYTFEEIAKELDIPLKSLYFYHESGNGPEVHKFGKHLRVAEVNLREWHNQNQLTKK
jgi:hypothetical protein